MGRHQWEYQTVAVVVGGQNLYESGPEYMEQLRDLNRECNDRGADGWELVCRVGTSNPVILLFKRLVEVTTTLTSSPTYEARDDD